MVKRLSLYSVILIFVILTIAGCKRFREMPAEMEGNYILYRVEYLEEKAGDIPTDLLPKKMEAYYTKNHVATHIDGFLGQFSLVQIANLRKRTVTTMLSFFGNKIYHTGQRGELPVGIHPLEDAEIMHSSDTLHLSGVPAFKATVHTSGRSYDIYYTREIDIRDPNITTPYPSIEYVLCDFQVQLSQLKMRLIMEDHQEKTIDTSVFNIPEEYREVSHATMEQIINNLFTKE